VLPKIMEVLQMKEKGFPARMPVKQPTDRLLSAAMKRMYEVWNPYEDRSNPFYTSFKYSAISGIGKEAGISRRDASKVLKLNDTYYVWYTRRQTEFSPVGPEACTDELPAYDWDLADIAYATSKDGFHWVEQGVAVGRAPRGSYGDRSLSTPDILVFEGKYYLYYQTYTGKFEKDKGDYCDVSMAWSDGPDGPWHRIDKPVLELGSPDEWDSKAIHDPYLLIYEGQVWLYYKGAPLNPDGDRSLIARAQGVAIASCPEGPFCKSPLNPVLNSGHETALYPYGEGIAAIVSRDGPEKNTVQYAADGLNFNVKAHISMPPLAPGLFCPDVFADEGDGQGVTWGLSHTFTGDGCNYLLRFDCDLRKDAHWSEFKHADTRYDEAAFLQPVMRLEESRRKELLESGYRNDRATILR
jgi:hypothetical protein